MESDLGKLFIGGISWDTDENRLKEYFGTYGEVMEAVIMRDRATGRARGFGFIVFVDPAVAERVVMEKHMIDGRTVEAKKAVPRDDQHTLNRNNSSIQGSPGPGRTKKIFVGGLASTVTESDFKKYFDQFGTITDVVVMYDHNTQRPRGFGFITYDMEEAVDRVLHKTFHELNGKLVEVKRAVPKELSPGPSRSPLVGYNYGFGRMNNFLNSYARGYNLGSIGGYGVRMDGRINPIGSTRNAFSPFGSLGYGMDVSLDPALSLGFGGNSNFGNNLGYGRVLSPYYSGNSNRYSTPIGYGGAANFQNEAPLSSSTRNVWGNTGLNNAANASIPDAHLGSGAESFRIFGNRANWGSSTSPQGGGGASGYTRGAIGYSGGENNYRLNGEGIRRNSSASIAATSSSAASSGGYEGSYGDLYHGGSMYGDSTWFSASSEMDGSGALGYGLSNGANVSAKGFPHINALPAKHALMSNSLRELLNPGPQGEGF
ncbi:RNA-binding (RRM/RBD/RNP motifs) family protein [Actinidia rufa]|uniref:RNA-binding (RRM/RBD/RNP motifs) family protein n=1 Tax=Actinidia rufa TaxID=165716 RepID=A0A7J0G9A6_9ERIC|nr:RNA-binding (RRM/RBD/RNP motifs) family protein [Actinidia rufa]